MVEGEEEGALPTVPPGPGTGPSQPETIGTGNFIIIHSSYLLKISGHFYLLLRQGDPDSGLLAVLWIRVCFNAV